MPLTVAGLITRQAQVAPTGKPCAASARRITPCGGSTGSKTRPSPGPTASTPNSFGVAGVRAHTQSKGTNAMTMLSKSFTAIGVCAMLAVSATAQPGAARDALASRLVRHEIQRTPSSIQGREIVQVLTEIPVDAESGWHVHPGEEVGYIIAGRVEMKVEGRDTMVLNVGDGFLIPPGTPHNARDLGPDVGRMLSTYIVETAQPLATFVDPPVER